MTMIATALLMLVAQPAVGVDQVGSSAERPEREAIEQVGPTERSVDPIYVQPDTEQEADAVAQISAREVEIELATVEGIDRCSAELLTARDAEYCARRIEARSEEFVTDNEAKLTAEQVLIGERFSNLARSGDIAGASRNAGRRDISAEDTELQALASLTLVTPSEPATVSEEPGADGDLSTETQALIEAIVENLANPGGG